MEKLVITEMFYLYRINKHDELECIECYVVEKTDYGMIGYVAGLNKHQNRHIHVYLSSEGKLDRGHIWLSKRDDKKAASIFKDSYLNSIKRLEISISNYKTKIEHLDSII